MGKIISMGDLDRIRHEHDSIVLCSGCYDILQSGHAVFFNQCKQYGTLVVSVGRDNIVSKLKPGRPKSLGKEIENKFLESKTYEFEFEHKDIISLNS